MSRAERSSLRLVDHVPPRDLQAVDGSLVSLPDPDTLLHLQFRRFAGCPICNLHLRGVVRRYEEIVAAGVREVVFFHSTAEELNAYDFPFPVVADPTKRFYREFGVESSWRSVLDPRAWGAIMRGSALTLAGTLRRPASSQPGGRLGLPADFLVAPDGRVLASKHGAHADDQWSVDELLSHARAAR